MYIVRKGKGTIYHLQRKQGLNTACRMKDLRRFKISNEIPEEQRLCKSCALELLRRTQ